MATTITTTCDRCKRSCDGEPEHHIFTYGITNPAEELDLCTDCTRSMVQWVKAGVVT